MPISRHKTKKVPTFLLVNCSQRDNEGEYECGDRREGKKTPFYPGHVQEKRSIRVVPWQWELTFKLTQFKVYIFNKRFLGGSKL